MAYSKTTWKSGDVISASKMNNIENGIKTLDDTIGGDNGLIGRVATLESDTSWIPLNDNIWYRVKNGVCTVAGSSYGSLSLTPNEYKIVGTLPEIARPSVEIPLVGGLFGSDQLIDGFISSNGTINLYSNGSTVFTYWRFSCTYLVG